MMTLGNFIPITVLVKTELVKRVGGFPTPFSEVWPYKGCEDWGLWQQLLRAGATFVHYPERTWAWVHHHGHTSGESWTGPRTTVDI
jgi:hypothetical protein